MRYFNLEISNTQVGIANARFKMTGDPCELMLSMHACMDISPEFRALIMTVAETYERSKDQRRAHIVINLNGN